MYLVISLERLDLTCCVQAARDWLVRGIGGNADAVAKHFVAVLAGRACVA